MRLESTQQVEQPVDTVGDTALEAVPLAPGYVGFEGRHLEVLFHVHGEVMDGHAYLMSMSPGDVGLSCHVPDPVGTRTPVTSTSAPTVNGPREKGRL